MEGFKALLDSLTPKTTQGGSENDLAKALLSVVGGQAGNSPLAQFGGDAIRKQVQAGILAEVEKQFKDYLVKQGVGADALGNLSLKKLVEKGKEITQKSDDELWGEVQKLMIEKGGLNDVVSGMLVGLLKQNVSMDTVRNLVSGDVSKQLLEDVLKGVNNNPQLANLVGDRPECLQMLSTYMQKGTLSVPDMLAAIQHCGPRRGDVSDSEGDYSDAWKAPKRKKPIPGAAGRDEEEEDEEDEEDDDEDEEDDEEDEDEGEEDEGSDSSEDDEQVEEESEDESESDDILGW
jgi:hypothetical protein